VININKKIINKNYEIHLNETSMTLTDTISYCQYHFNINGVIKKTEKINNIYIEIWKKKIGWKYFFKKITETNDFNVALKLIENNIDTENILSEDILFKNFMK